MRAERVVDLLRAAADRSAVCTLILATRCWPEAPLVVAANRDEALARPAGPPRAWLDRPLPLVAPEDLEAGGTWLGLNAHGVFVGITNRFGVPKAPERRSRGRLVLEALAHPSAEDAFAWASGLHPEEENGFHLVMADRRGAFLVWGDGRRLTAEALAPGIHAITERSFGAAESARLALLERWVEAQRPEPPSLEALAALLRTHQTAGLEGVCVHAPELAYGTRSSTVVVLGAEGRVELHHAPGPPCITPHRDEGPLLEALAEGARQPPTESAASPV